MTDSHTTWKVYEEKVDAQLQEAKLQLEALEAHAKGQVAETELDTIKELWTQKPEIEKRRHDLKSIDEAKLAQARAEIDAELAKLKSSLDALATKLKRNASHT